MHYDDFTLQIGARRGPQKGYRVRLITSPAGEGRGLLELPETSWASFLPSAVGSQRGGAAPQRMPRHGILDREGPPPSIQNVGDQLFRSLFSSRILSLYDQSLGSLSGQENRGLRIKIKLDLDDDIGELHDLPWELMFRAETRDFLGLSRRSPIVRYLDVPRPSRPIPLPDPLRVLLVTAGPGDQEALNLDTEVENIQKATAHQSSLKVEVLNRCSLKDLRHQLLQETYHVLHYMGHGTFCKNQDEGALLFESPTGESEPVTGSELAVTLSDFRSLQLVFLNACETARTSSLSNRAEGNPFSGVATALVRGGLPAVVAMRAPISDRAAIELGSTFYSRLATGDPVDTALTEGRQAIYLCNPRSAEWSTPLLFMRVPNGQLFKAPEKEIHPILGTPTSPAKPASVGTTPVIDGPARPTPDPSGHRRRRALPSPRRLAASILPLLLLLWASYGARDPLSQLLVGDGVIQRPDQLKKPAIDPVEPPEDTDDQGEAQERASREPDPSPRVAERKPEPTAQKVEEQKTPIPKVERPLPPPGAAVLAKTQVFSSNLAGLQSEVDGIYFLEGGGMRWNFRFQNSSSEALAVGLRYSAIRLIDNAGRWYRVIDGTTSGPGSTFTANLASGSITYHWLDFEAPVVGARDFKVHLISDDINRLDFRPFEVELPPEVNEFARQVALDPVPYTVVKPAEASASGFSVSVVSIDQLPSGRMRWELEFANSSSQDLQLGFNYGSIYLTDDRGQRYRTLASDLSRNPEGRWNGLLQHGLTTRHWFEFSGPVNGAEEFTFVFGSSSAQQVRFFPFDIRLGERAASLSPTTTLPPHPRRTAAVSDSTSMKR